MLQGWVMVWLTIQLALGKASSVVWLLLCFSPGWWWSIIYQVLSFSQLCHHALSSCTDPCTAELARQTPPDIAPMGDTLYCCCIFVTLLRNLILQGHILMLCLSAPWLIFRRYGKILFFHLSFGAHTYTQILQNKMNAQVELRPFSAFSRCNEASIEISSSAVL